MRRAYIFNMMIVLLPALIVGGTLAASGDTSDGLKLLFLSLLGCGLIYQAIKQPHQPFLKWLAIIWWLVFWLHSIILSSTWLLYNSSADAYFILQSLANTSDAESLEFLQHNTYYIMIALLVWLGLLLVYAWLIKKYFNRHMFAAMEGVKLHGLLMIFLALLTATAWAMRPIRALSPPIYWAQYYQKMEHFLTQINEHQLWHKNWQQAAQKNIQMTPTFAAQQTIVLILSESVTSYNLGVCGYPRNTTPYLQAHIGELTVFCDAYSPYPSTLNAIKAMLTDAPAGQPDFIPQRSLLADAQAAGFQTFWLSNQDDAYLSSLFGSFAHHAVYSNKRSGRSSTMKDEAVLPHFKAALAHPAPRKLIVVHLIGSHPNYAARYPERFAQFPSHNAQAEAKITQQLNQADASLWVQEQRDDYDNSVLYQDWLFGQILQQVKQNGAENKAVVFVSDHGNEVGHEKDFAGHSPHTQAGYRIPVIMWHNRAHALGVNQHTRIDAAQLDQNMLFIMGLHNQQPSTWLPWTHTAYQFADNQHYPYWQKP